MGATDFMKFTLVHLHVLHPFRHAADLPAGTLDRDDKNGKAERYSFLKQRYISKEVACDYERVISVQ